MAPVSPLARWSLACVIIITLSSSSKLFLGTSKQFAVLILILQVEIFKGDNVVYSVSNELR